MSLEKALKYFDLDPAAVGGSDAGRELPFNLKPCAGTHVSGVIEVLDQMLRVTIVTVAAEKNDRLNGVRALRDVEVAAERLARAAALAEVEVLGVAFLNERLERLLVKLGYTPVEVPIPDDAGNVGTTQGLCKRLRLTEGAP